MYSQLGFLDGTWKLTDKEQYEVWEQRQRGVLQGYSFWLKDGERVVTETLQIRMLNGQLCYEATVPDQNAAATIPFTLNKEVTDRLSFENLQHDFPKKIQYRFLSADRVEVTVLGADGKGFSYIQKKTAEKNGR